jgi:hypothetical protein
MIGKAGRITVSVLAALLTFTAVGFTACEMDKCKEQACYNGGVCKDGTCHCPEGYAGTRCENIIAEKKYSAARVAGTWTGSEVCPVGTPTQYSFKAKISPTDVTKFTIDTIHGYMVEGTMINETDFTFIGKIGHAFLRGSGRVTGNTIAISFNERNPGGQTVLECVFTGQN